MKEWMCNTTGRVGFTKGNIYKTCEEGCLMDDDGYYRLTPEVYNTNIPT